MLDATFSEVSVPFERATFDISQIEADRQTVAATLFGAVDVLVLPTTTSQVPAIAAVADNPRALSAQNTILANYYGLGCK
jgi:hypothetical protein